jgi:hypothetical protein
MAEPGPRLPAMKANLSRKVHVEGLDQERRDIGPGRKVDWKALWVSQTGGWLAAGGGGGVEGDAVLADAELAHVRGVAAGPGLDDGQGPLQRAVVVVVVDHDHVVGQVGHGDA